MAPNSTQLSAITRLFSSAVFREMARKGRSPLFARLIRQTPVEDTGGTVGEAFDRAFGILRKSGLRDEYVYRSALTHKVLMGRHSLRTACMLTEFRAGECKADLVILNGTATVYEIKSERDSLARLTNQVENYRKVFAKTYVITDEAHIQGVIDAVPYEVGILKLSHRESISMVRDAEDRPDRVCPVTIFDSLRLVEARLVLDELDVPVPRVPNTRLSAELRECFRRLAPADVHVATVKVLKKTRDLAPLADLVNKLPTSLHAAALSVPIRRGDHGRVVGATETPLSAAMEWAH